MSSNETKTYKEERTKLFIYPIDKWVLQNPVQVKKMDISEYILVKKREKRSTPKLLDETSKRKIP